MPNVAANFVEPGTMTSRPDPLLCLFNTAKLEDRQTSRLVRRHAVAHPVSSSHIDESSQFVVQIPLRSVPTKRPTQDRREAMQNCQAPSSTLVTANATRFQRSRCCSSWRRPEAVRR